MLLMGPGCDPRQSLTPQSCAFLNVNYYTVSLLKPNLKRFLPILSFLMKAPIGMKVG